MQYAIETRNLTRKFGDYTAVENVTLAVPEGQIYGYLGLNGAGKSTTIKMLTTLLKPTSGEAYVAGRNVAREPLAVREVIGLVGDEGADSRPSWTPREYLGYFARVRGLTSPETKAELALETVGLEMMWRKRPIGTFSTGMKRRVDLARALLGNPRVLFLDEPTRGLDLPAKRETWDLLRELVATQRVTVFLSSHEVPEIQELCRELAIIAKGRVSFRGLTSDLGKTPQEFEASLIRLLRGPPPERNAQLLERKN